MKSDIPQWVVQVAETWGLYWGGYGLGRWLRLAAGREDLGAARHHALRVPWHAGLRRRPSPRLGQRGAGRPTDAPAPVADDAGAVTHVASPTPSNPRGVAHGGPDHRAPVRPPPSSTSRSSVPPAPAS
ncbi:MAG: hypothetical protein R2713_14500 [Ilumatobacteraceae bacterium]